MKKTMLIVAAAIMATAAKASILIDFDDGVWPTPTDTLGRYWNATPTAGNPGPITGYVVTDAVDENNAATTVDLNITSAFHGGYQNGPFNNYGLNDWDSTVTRDGYFLYEAGTATASMHLEGLTPGGEYDLYIFGARNVGAARVMDVTIGGTTQSYDAGQPAGDTTFSSVFADGSGNVVIDLAVGTGTLLGYLGGMSITTIPEPATLGMVGAFGAAILLVRRKLML